MKKENEERKKQEQYFDHMALSQIFSTEAMDESAGREKTYLTGDGKYQAQYNRLIKWSEWSKEEEEIDKEYEKGSDIQIKEEPVEEDEEINDKIQVKLIGDKVVQVRDNRTKLVKDLIYEMTIHQEAFNLVRNEYERVRNMTPEELYKSGGVSPAFNVLFYLNYELFSIFNLAGTMKEIRLYQNKWERLNSLYRLQKVEGSTFKDGKTSDDPKKYAASNSIYFTGAVDCFLFYHFLSLEEIVLDQLEERRDEEKKKVKSKRPPRGWKRGIVVDLEKYYNETSVPMKDRYYPEEYESIYHFEDPENRDPKNERDEMEEDNSLSDVNKIQERIGNVIRALLIGAKSSSGEEEEDNMEEVDQDEEDSNLAENEMDAAVDYWYLLTEQFLNVVTMYTTYMHFKMLQDKIRYFESSFTGTRKLNAMKDEFVHLYEILNIQYGETETSELDIMEARFRQASRYWSIANVEPNILYNGFEIAPMLILPVDKSIKTFSVPQIKSEPQVFQVDGLHSSQSKLPDSIFYPTPYDKPEVISKYEKVILPPEMARVKEAEKQRKLDQMDE